MITDKRKGEIEREGDRLVGLKDWAGLAEFMISLNQEELEFLGTIPSEPTSKEETFSFIEAITRKSKEKLFKDYPITEGELEEIEATFYKAMQEAITKKN